MQLPRMLYRFPGSWQLECGNSSLLVVNTQEELAAALADGWFADAYDAKAAFEGKAEAKQEPEPSARDAMEAEAKALGIKVDGRWSDKRLSDAIKAAK